MPRAFTKVYKKFKHMFNIFKHACTCVPMHTHSYTHVHACTHNTCMHALTQTHAHMHTHTRTHAHTHTHTHTQSHNHTHAHTHRVTYTHTHAQSHTHTHTHPCTQCLVWDWTLSSLGLVILKTFGDFTYINLFGLQVQFHAPSQWCYCVHSNQSIS